MFRPVNMLWVDLLIEREAAPVIMDHLAEAGVIELQGAVGSLPDGEALGAEYMARLRRLESRLAPMTGDLPTPDPRQLAPFSRRAPLAAVIDDLEDACVRWLDGAAAIVAALHRLSAENEDLELLASALAALPDDAIELSALEGSRGTGGVRPFLAIVAERSDDASRLLEASRNSLTAAYPSREAETERTVLIGLCPSAAWPALEHVLQECDARLLSIPAVLQGAPRQARAQLATLIGERRQEMARQRKALRRLNRETRIAGYYWLLRRHLWLAAALEKTQQGRRFVEIGGWVPRNRFDELRDCLLASGAPHLIRGGEAAGHGVPPVVLDNPPWMKRFEIFVSGFGMPSRDEVDPSPLLAVVTPLMFGYMFGDVGQGAVLVAVGLLARRRVPVLGLLVPAGISAALFGLLFGSVFCYEGLLQPLWLHPFDAPMTVLGVPLVFGAALLLTGIAFAGIEARWRGAVSSWWVLEFPLLIAFAAVVAGVYSLDAMWIGLLGAVVWTAAASVVAGAGKASLVKVIAGAAAHVAELVENGLQLAVNTLSFARVGAFALAHAGLSSAVVTLAGMAEGTVGQAIVFVLGNVLVIALEGLVVSIQTTRLVMYEFFRRFLRGQGRRFRPLSLEHHPGIR